MNKSRAILVSIFIVMIVGVIVCFSSMPEKSTKKYYLSNEILEVFLPKEYSMNEADPVQVFYGDSEVAHIRFGTLSSFQFMEKALINNEEENIILLEQSTKDNCMYLYYCTITNNIPEYVYIIYVRDTDTTIMLSSIDKERIEIIFNNLALKVIPYDDTNRPTTTTTWAIERKLYDQG